MHAMRLSDGTEIGYNADEPEVMASIVKVPIGLEFYAQAFDGRVNPSQAISLSPPDCTPGPTGISRFNDPVSASLRDLAYLMLTISDNAATDAVTRSVGLEAVNARLVEVGCRATSVQGDIQTMLDEVGVDLGFSDYRELLQAQAGNLGPEAHAASTSGQAFEACRALDPDRGSVTTARDQTRLLGAIWSDRAAPQEACSQVRSVMAEQVTRRLAPAVLDGGHLAAKSGGLFGRIRNEIGVITDPGGEHFAVAVLTRADQAFAKQREINEAMARSVALAVSELRRG